MANMPMIFQTSTLTYEERFPVYRDQILGACRASKVTSNFAKYVELLVKKRGWKAIWSCPDEDVNMNENLNILVEIVNVFPQNLSSEVNICVPVVSNPPVTFQDAQALIHQQNSCIPLTDLLPVFDESGDFDQTALALEHVRFFFENLWREYDLDVDEDYCYTARHLENRLRLYYDITQNNLSKEFIKKYNATLNEYKQKLVHLKELRENMSASDSEQELDTSDVFTLAQKTHELEDLVRSLQTMEDPHMRYLLASAKSKTQAALGRVRTYPVTIIVAEKLAVKMIKHFPDETIIEHLKSLEKGIESSNVDDRIVIYPGHYNVGSFVFKHSLSATGNGNVIVECDEDDENFLTTQCRSIKFENIKFIHKSSSSCCLVVEEGQTVLRGCEFRCNGDHGILVRKGAELIMENCKVYGSMNIAVTIEENSLVRIERCEILSENINRNMTAIKVYSSATQPAKIEIIESRIVANCGITITNDQGTRAVRESIENDSVKLKLMNNLYECDHEVHS